MGAAPRSKEGKMRGAIRMGINRLPHLQDRQTYESFLQSASGTTKTSTKDMDARELGRVLDALRKAGFAPKVDRETAKQKALVVHMWGQLHSLGIVSNPDKKALASWFKKMCRADLDTASGTYLQSGIEKLKKWAAREGYDLMAEAAHPTAKTPPETMQQGG